MRAPQHNTDNLVGWEEILRVVVVVWLAVGAACVNTLDPEEPPASMDPRDDGVKPVDPIDDDPVDDDPIDDDPIDDDPIEDDPVDDDPVDDDPLPPAPPVITGACDAHAAELESLAQQFVDVLAAQEISGGVFGVAIGDCEFTYGVGRDREGTPIDAHTRFQMASVSKMFGAIAANSLVDDGLIDKTAPASTIVNVNDSAPYDESFTLELLLAHRSGYPDWFMSDDGTTLDRSTFFAAHTNEALWYPPDEAYIYNNIGYTLAGHLIEVAAGSSYAQLVQQRVLDAIGMSDTRMGSTLDPNELHSAIGHSGAPGAVTRFGTDDEFFRSELYEPMGGVWSSAADMLILGRALNDRDPRLLSSEMHDDLVESRGPSTGTTGDYALGLMIYGDVVTHGGATSGFLTELSMVPSRDVVFAAMVDADWYFPYEIEYAAFDMFAPGLDWGPTPETRPSSFWAGTYQDDVIVGRVIIEAQGDDLRLSFPDVDWGPSVPTTMIAELVWDDCYVGPFFDWGEGELVMQVGSDGTRYAASRNFVASAP